MIAAPSAAAGTGPFAARLIAAAEARVGKTVVYDPAYVPLKYPGGDVPSDRGVCTDVIIRAYRAVGIDLQQRVHEDMRRAFRAYPRRWGLKRPDPNIDHRRVPNLRRFFKRHGKVLPGTRKLSRAAAAGREAFARTPHIGIVTGKRTPEGRPLIVHNIGAGTRVEDILFGFEITGRYRFEG